ncbi:MAG: hypothetical protein Q4C59_14925, partial [Lachnospiraceae bacterium]|nr:hypothetical protein [Lachnospiraceae bacterium]
FIYEPLVVPDLCNKKNITMKGNKTVTSSYPIKTNAKLTITIPLFHHPLSFLMRTAGLHENQLLFPAL